MEIKVLSFAGRSTLIKSTIESLPSYIMHTYELPIKVCKRINGKIHDFWWRHEADRKRKMYFKSWQSMYIARVVGELGFIKITDSNETFNTKLAWKVWQGDTSQVS